MSNRLEGETALVTGAGRGIGRAIATAYAAEGARVALLDVEEATVADVAETLDTETLALGCDVRSTDAVERSVDRIVETFDSLDVVVNNAGVIGRRALVETEDAEMERVLDVNLKGTMRVARATLPHLVETGGAMINVSSQLARAAVKGVSVYTASKGGISSLTRQLAVEHADDGVRVNALAPGIVDTEMTGMARDTEPGWQDDRLERIPLNRLGDPSDIAGPAVFLASEEAGYVTGEVLTVDGGYLAR
jgi:D-sorbitol dehydrogenase (acceptor)